ncbi:MAG: NAD-binding protein [Promethearchaeota archaeon]
MSLENKEVDLWYKLFIADVDVEKEIVIKKKKIKDIPKLTLGLLLGLWRSLRNIKLLNLWLKVDWIIVLIVGIATILLGSIGFLKHFNGLGVTFTGLDVVYFAIQLFVINLSLTGPFPWQLEIARFLAPIILVYVGSRTLLLLLNEEFTLFKLRRIKYHTIICGLGKIGIELLKSYPNRNNTLVIEINERTAIIKSGQEGGPIISANEIIDRSMLLKARVNYANNLIVVTEDDEINLEIAAKAFDIVQEKRRSFFPLFFTRSLRLNCVVHLSDFNTLIQFSSNDHFLADTPRFCLKFFDIYENAARLLFHKYPLDFLADTISSDAPPVHLVVVGFDEIAQHVVLQALKQGHYANGKELYITISDKAADEKKQIFYQQYPYANMISKYIYFEQMTFNELICFATGQLKEKIDRPPITAFIICPESDSIGYSSALFLLRGLKEKGCNTPIFVHMESDYGFALLLQTEDNSQDSFMQPFGMINQISTWKLVMDDLRSDIARFNHDQNIITKVSHMMYLGARLEQEGEEVIWQITAEELKEWATLRRSLKDSYLQTVDHIPVKLRAIGCGVRELKGESSLFEFERDEIELLANMEHRRWMADKYLKGYTYDETIYETDHRNKRHPYLLPFDELTEGFKDYARKPVIIIPGILKELGLEVFRLNEA